MCSPADLRLLGCSTSLPGLHVLRCLTSLTMCVVNAIFRMRNDTQNIDLCKAGPGIFACFVTTTPGHLKRICSLLFKVQRGIYFSTSASQLWINVTHGFVFYTLVQVWDVVSGRLRKDLQYQADEQFMMHDSAVIALAVSRDSEMLASGSQDGKIKACCSKVPLDRLINPWPEREMQLGGK